jgi:peptidoglycan/xylan/chitin deacetylase (PgdA/CDA1 family)/tetratricopeptide (TPR) repeat protein
MRGKLLIFASAALVVLAGVAVYLASRRNSEPPAAAVAQAPARTPAAASPSIAEQLDGIVANFRKIIVLTQNEDALDEALRGRVLTVGRLLFQQNVVRLEVLSGALTGELSGASFPLTEDFLTRVETGPDLHDADKLAFRGVFDDLAAEIPQHPGAAALGKRVADDIAALKQIQAMYEKEIQLAFREFEPRGMTVRREAWERYLAFLNSKYQREQILKEYESALPPPESRGTVKKKKSANEIQGPELPPKTLLLTFDDGPHPRYTDQILAILKKYKINAVFFEVGRIGSFGKDGSIQLTKASAASYHAVEDGSTLANHSYSHALLTKLDQPAFVQEIESTDKLLLHIDKTDAVLFRPPYGATNNSILDYVAAQKMKVMLWNIDSLDWADPIPKSIIQRLLTRIAAVGRGIVLFHDIHPRAAEVLPTFIETVEAEGYRFTEWKGSDFAPETAAAMATQAAAAVPAPGSFESPYRESWAAVIGIDDYQSWPKLRYAVKDAQAVRDMLIQKYHFKPENVFTLLDKEATRENILSLLGDKLANASMVKHDDRVFVFFAGHGATRKLASGRDLGYIIPVDGGISDYQGQAISMSNFQDISEAIPAKHLLFVMDSCYSGLALTRGGSGMPGSQNYLQEIARREARQMFTAGGADEEVADNGPNGHSIFTWTLLQGLDGRADLNGDGIITGTELAAYVIPAVSSLSHQTPVFGNLVGSEGGDFIFELKHESEFLTSASPQLGEDAIKLNAELEGMRAQILEATKQNEELKKQLAAAQALLQRQKKQAGQPAHAADSALGLNDEGMRLYKEKRYAEAYEKFIAAAKLDPKNALLANNAGFALYRQGKYEDSARWIEQAIAIDPNRAIAYINLGDAYVALNRTEDAKRAFQKYLDLSPTGKSAPYAREKLKSLEH